MESLDIEIFLDGGWQRCGDLILTGGQQEKSNFIYDVDFYFEYCNEISNSGAGQVSVNCPLNLDGYEWPTLAPFAMDIRPIGITRRHLAEKYDISSEADFLKFGANNPVGNLRTQAVFEPEKTSFSLGDVRIENEAFKQLAAIKGGTDVQGDAPKLIAVKAGQDWFIDNGAVAGRHFILKFPRTRNREGELVLETEYKYIQIAKEFGLNVQSLSDYFYLPNHVLGIPRFDIQGEERFGLESLYSVMGTIGSGVKLNQFECAKKIYELCGVDDLIEYVKRDMVNFAFGNTDNHGRNTSFLKSKNEVRLAPLYDFAPMILDSEVIRRTSNWIDEETSAKINWLEVINELEGLISADLSDLKLFEETLPDRAEQFLSDFDVDREVINTIQPKIESFRK